MDDDQELYWQDILVWSEQQAALLRRLARGEQVNGVDWDHVIEEIEDVGRSELHSVQSLLRQAMVHLLKAAAWPEAHAREHWKAEIPGFLADADSRFAPSMVQKIDLQKEYRKVLRQIDGQTIDGRKPIPVPQSCPFTLEALLAGEYAPLEHQLQVELDADRHVV